MKTKIKEALKQEYKNLGLTEEAFDRVAAFGETIVKEETGIADFVKGADAILKGYQSLGDKLRTELANTKKEFDAYKIAHPESKEQEPPQPSTPPTPPQPNLAEEIAKAVTAAIKPMQDKLNAYEAKETSKGVRDGAKAKFAGNEYVKAYKDEADDAWERAIEMFEATGNKLSETELHDKAMGYFNKAVARKGVDTSKPFEDPNKEKDTAPDFEGMKQRLQAKGLMPADS